MLKYQILTLALASALFMGAFTQTQRCDLRFAPNPDDHRYSDAFYCETGSKNVFSCSKRSCIANSQGVDNGLVFHGCHSTRGPNTTYLSVWSTDFIVNKPGLLSVNKGFTIRKLNEPKEAITNTILCSWQKVGDANSLRPTCGTCWKIK
ncbi:hypothetical protein O181_039337 [Austropuccinia psidii MF-1]|uniref:Secreted protein n=1 Tax=Austropuccinia psidii MF-1 TaxID=1389203 RepID=A0A9Q3DGL8_9BASI|nr:hypothetical protein [Austropuccinia psidii MF-1]